MGSKSSSQPQYLPTVQSSNQSQSGSSSGTSTTSADPLARLAYEQTLANAAQIAQTPFQPYQGQMIAGFTPDQIAAMEGIRQSQGIQNPYLQRSGGLYNQLANTWQNPAMGQVQSLYGRSLNYIPNQYMPAVQNYANTAASASTNPLLSTAQKYGQQAAISSLNPYMGTAQGYLGESLDISDIDKFNQAALSRYMSPYQQSVIDATLAQMKQNQDVLQNQNTANAIRQGAYGGSGQFMGQAELGRQQALSNAQTLAGLNQANYQQAMGQYNQQQQQAIQALQQAASTSGQLGQQQAALTAGTLSNVGQMLGQLGQQQSNLKAQTGLNLAQLYGDLGNQLAQRGIQSYQNAAQNLGQLGQQQQALGVQALGNAAQGIGNLGEQAQKANLTDLQALLSTGQLQQQLGQQQLTNAYNQWLQARAYPYQQTSYFGGLAGGLGPLLGQTGTTSTTSQSTSSGSGTGISPYQQQQSGGGSIPGLITTGLGILSALKNGGVVKERKAFADGGEAEDDDSFVSLISKSPYSGSELGSPVTSKAGLGSLMTKKPYDAPSDYIGEASKLQNIIKPASSLGRENLLSQINKLIDEIPTMKKFEMDMPEGNMKKFSKYGSGESEGDDWSGPLKAVNKLAHSEKFQNFASDGFGKIASMFADGGAVDPAAAQNQAKQVLENYQKFAGKAPDQKGFESLIQRTSAPAPMSPSRISSVVRNYVSNQPAPPAPETLSNYDLLLQQAYARNPGPQLTPEQQGMPSMPSQDYYTGRDFGSLVATAGRKTDDGLGIAQSMALPDKANVVKPASPYASAEDAHRSALNAIQNEQTGLAYAYAAMGVNPGLATVLAVQATQGKVDQANRDLNAAKADVDRRLAAQPPVQQNQAEKLGLPANYQNFVTSLYKNYLGRDPSESEIDTQLKSIVSGTKPSELETSLRTSGEGKQTQSVQNLYEDIFGKSADLGSLSFWKQKLSEGVPLSQLSKLMSESPEAKSSATSAPVQGYYSKIANTQFNPYTGLFNLDYVAPYRGTNVRNFLPRQDGGAVGKASGGSLSGKDLYDYLISLGANAKEASMLTGMAKAESAFNPYVMHDKGSGFGLWGHGRDRWADMQKFTGQHKPGWEEQAKFALWELRNSPKTALARQALSRAQDARDVAIAGMHFERPAGYRADAPWQGKNWQQRFANVSNLMSGKDIGSGMIGRVDSAPGSDASSFVRSQGIGVPSATPSRPNFLARLINALSPVGTAHAETAAPMTILPDWKQEVKTGFGPLQGEKPADAQQLLAAPTQHANMGPEMPSDNVVASDKKDGQKYWGDYRDVEASSFGDLIDALAGDVKASDKPGTRETPMGKYQGQGGLGGLFDFEGTNPYAPQKKAKEEESFDLGHLFDIFG